MIKSTWRIYNFFKSNTPRWAETIGNYALILGGAGVTMGGFMVGIPQLLEVVPGYANTIPANTLADLSSLGSSIAGWSAVAGGAIKSFSKCFGIPLKDINKQ